MSQSIYVSVDAVLLTLDEGVLKVALWRRPSASNDRAREPFPGALALPGGTVNESLDLDDAAAAVRVLQARVGVRPPYLEQLRTFVNGRRDPRGWSAAIAHYALVHADALAEARQSGLITLHAVDDLPRLAFDHNEIVAVAVARLRSKSSYSTLPCYLLPEQFTMSQLQSTYEQVLGHQLDQSSFRRKISELDVLEPVRGPGAQTSGGRHRPAQLYRLRQDRRLALFDKTV
jgi:8-oxo-dGTP diphosphatase